MTRGNVDVELGVGGVADLRGGIFSGQRRELGRSGKYQGGVRGLIVPWNGVGAGLRAQLRTAVQELHDVGNAEDMLVKSGEKEDLVALDGTADGASHLLLPVMRLEGEKRIAGAERTIAQIVEPGAMQVIGAGFRDHIHHRASGSSLLCSIGIR